MGNGGRSGPVSPSTGLMTRSWMNSCIRCVIRVGQSRRAWTKRRSVKVGLPLRSGIGQYVRRGNRILDGEVDSDPADGGHGMRRVTDTEQARP